MPAQGDSARTRRRRAAAAKARPVTKRRAVGDRHAIDEDDRELIEGGGTEEKG